MLDIVLVLSILICAFLALQAGESARRARQESKSLQDEVRSDILRLQEATTLQDERLRRLQKAVADLRMESDRALQMIGEMSTSETAPLPSDTLVVPRVMAG